MEICLGWSSYKLCPVVVILAYPMLRDDKGGQSFFIQWDPLTENDYVVTQVCQALVATCKDPVLHNGHSFRIGAMSMATARGIKDLLINIHGAGRAWSCVKIPRMVLQSKIDSVLPEQHAIVECTNRCCCIACQK